MTSTGPSRTEDLRRFGRTSRLVHLAVGVLMIICLVTAAVLYNSFLAIPLGHRRVFELVHVYAGFALPVPLLIGLLTPAYRDDLGRLNRFTPADWRWLRTRTRRDGRIRVGKFNAGQKLNACLTAGAIVVLLGTGTIMFFPDAVRLSWRSGATFVHDWFALGVGLLVLGHLSFALKDPQAMRGMRSGTVSSTWAVREHGLWAQELGVTTPDAPDGSRLAPDERG